MCTNSVCQVEHLHQAQTRKLHTIRQAVDLWIQFKNVWPSRTGEYPPEQFKRKGVLASGCEGHENVNSAKTKLTKGRTATSSAHDEDSIVVARTRHWPGALGYAFYIWYSDAIELRRVHWYRCILIRNRRQPGTHISGLIQWCPRKIASHQLLCRQLPRCRSRSTTRIAFYRTH